jgi:hypothetical protein
MNNTLSRVEPYKPSRVYANAMLTTLLVNIPLCFAMVGLLLLMPIGAWQVLDALARVVQGDQRRRPYLVIVAVYFIGLYLQIANEVHGLDLEIYLFGASYLIGFWYWYITLQHAKETAAPPSPITHSEVLDDDPSFRHKEPYSGT